MIQLYDNILSSLFEITDNFFLTILIVAIINTVLTKIIEKYFEDKTSIIKNFNDFISNKEKSIIDKKQIFSLHEKFNYNPFYKLIEIVPFLIQLPFLLSVYFSLKDFNLFKNLDFFILNDISNPDNLLLGVNLLPFLMFFVNLIIIKITKNKISKIDFLFPVLFLILLYDSPSSLIIYWIISQILNSSLPRLRFKSKVKSFYTIILIPFTLLKIDSLNNILNIFLFLFLFLLFENIFLKKIKKLNHLIFPIFFTLFYSSFFHDLLTFSLKDFIINDQLLISMYRYQYSLFILLILSFLTSFVKEKKIKIIFSILSISILVTNSYSYEKPLKFEYSKTINSPKKSKKNQNTIILIVLDEYASPNELSDFLNRGDLYSFSKKLLDDNWILKKEFFSNETSTTLSMFSIFNYNLTGKRRLIEKTKSNLYTNFLQKEDLYKSDLLNDLRKNNLKIESYGLFNFNEKRDDEFLPKWEDENIGVFYNLNEFMGFLSFLNNDTFVYDILSKTIFSNIDAKYKVEKFRESIFKYFNHETSMKYDFVYYHFHMPHPPFRFKNEFKYNGKSTEQYVKFWKFTNKKFIELLEDFKVDNHKIILIGDHGYRANKNINPNNTFGAFYGFNSNEINDILTVQDVGLLIRDNLIE